MQSVIHPGVRPWLTRRTIDASRSAGAGLHLGQEHFGLFRARPGDELPVVPCRMENSHTTKVNCVGPRSERGCLRCEQAVKAGEAAGTRRVYRSLSRVSDCGSAIHPSSVASSRSVGGIGSQQPIAAVLATRAATSASSTSSDALHRDQFCWDIVSQAVVCLANSVTSWSRTAAPRVPLYPRERNPHTMRATAGYASTKRPPPLRSMASPVAALSASRRTARNAGTAIRSVETLRGHRSSFSFTTSSVLRNRSWETPTAGQTVEAE